MKKTLSFILAFCLLAALAVPLAVFTASADTDGYWTYTVSNGKATITGYSGTDTEIIIPDTLGGYPVWAVSGYMPSHSPFSDPFSDKSITSIRIPDSVTSIGSCAFSSCSSLTSITIPDSVTSIGQYAFYKCSKLTSITIPDSVTSIGDWAFLGCTSLTSITIPDSVTNIGSEAFYGCTSLTSITIPDNVQRISKMAFQGCTNLSEVTILGSPILGNDVFTDSQGLPLDLTLYGYRDSSVKAYALANALNFVPLDGEEPEYVYGDCDDDGALTLADVTLLAKKVAGWDVVLGPQA